MRLNNVHRVGDAKASNIGISNGKISDGSNTSDKQLQLIFDKAIIFPGIVNSHDHLDFNLFPKFGNKIYKNYTEWGNYIHQNHQQEIVATLNIPIKLRTQWGIYRNLLCGVTTVVNHGDKLDIEDAPITVFKHERSLHSVHFDKDWKRHLNHPFKKNYPIVIHTGEGIDQLATNEIDQLIRWNFLHRTLIGVHGVAMTVKQARRFKALVWCPQSNYYLLGQTAAVNQLKKATTILFGTDSTLTGDWNIWEHLRTAKQTGVLTDDELLKHFTTNPALVWGINSGIIEPGYDASLVIARMKDEQNPVSSLFAVNPVDILLVLHKGEIRLFDELLYSQLTDLPKDKFSKININGAYKYVYGDMPGLIKNIRRYHKDVQFPVTCNGSAT